MKGGNLLRPETALMASGGYPAAYRPASRPLRVPSTAPLSRAGNAARVPGSFPGLTPANTNAAVGGFGRALPIAGRLLPLIGYALLLWELWKLYNDFLAFQNAVGLASGWQRTRTHCGGAEDWFGPNNLPDGFCNLNTSNPGVTCPDLSAEVGIIGAHSGVTSYACLGPDPVFTTRVNYRPSFGYQRLSGTEPWRNPDEVSPGILPTPARAPINPLPAIIPQVLPEAAPAPGTPQPEPAPVPYNFVPWLPTESPVHSPIRGPSRPVRPRRNPYRVPRPVRRPTRRPTPNRRPHYPDRIPRPAPTEPPLTEPRRDPWFIPFPEIPPLADDDLGVEPSPETTPEPIPAPSPELVPSSNVEFLPGRKPRVRRGFHRLRRPGKRTREKKIFFGTSREYFVVRGINSATEYCDFVDALYDALPQEIRDRVEADRGKLPEWFHRSPGMNVPCHVKAQAVWENLNALDGHKALTNLALNQVIDFVFGRAGKAAGEVGRAIGAPVGLGTGPAL